MAQDEYANQHHGLEAPAKDADEITPNDSEDLTTTSRAIYIGFGGSLRVTTRAGNVRNFSGLTAGSILPIRVSRIHATGTTASGLVALL